MAVSRPGGTTVTVHRYITNSLADKEDVPIASRLSLHAPHHWDMFPIVVDEVWGLFLIIGGCHEEGRLFET